MSKKVVLKASLIIEVDLGKAEGLGFWEWPEDREGQVSILEHIARAVVQEKWRLLIPSHAQELVSLRLDLELASAEEPAISALLADQSQRLKPWDTEKIIWQETVTPRRKGVADGR